MEHRRNPQSSARRFIAAAIEHRMRKMRKALGMTVEHKFSTATVILPADHLLPVYQREHRLYDRFLPYLVKFIEPQSIVIDVGANCGDTLAAMHDANGLVTYICIEADSAFFEFLERNAQRIRDRDQTAHVVLVKALVGRQVTGVLLEGVHGTKHAVVASPNSLTTGLLSSQTLDALVLQEASTHSKRIRLIKSDVDGFDYDVIDSASSIIAEQHPILFFECDHRNSGQREGYERTLDWLRTQGYESWVIFDNFGEVLLRTSVLGDVLQLVDYISRQKSRCTSRTIHYFDLLAATRKDCEQTTEAVNAYLKV
jgi:FkbM family methyltransferase